MKRPTIHSGEELDSLAALGRGLALARRRRRLTQATMADRMGVNRQTYMALERNPASVSIGVLLRALGVLGYPARLGALMAQDPIGEKLEEALGVQRVREPDVADF